MKPLRKSDKEWREALTEEQYRVLRGKGTELPFSGNLTRDEGVFTCAGCGAELFKSSDRYESNQPGLEGWPSFADVVKSEATHFTDDFSHGMQRVEVTCARCGGHLGHFFPDDSSPSGQHYCINAVALGFNPKKS